jgi:hypothetical protein
MSKQRTWRSIVFSDTGILVMLALVRFLPLIFNNGQTGWHRGMSWICWITLAIWPGGT